MATTRLILLRHAKSDWHSGAQTDFERPLNSRGRRAAPDAGRWLQARGLVPDVVCCSSAERTRETLELVSNELDLSAAATHFLDALYHAGVTDMLQVIADYQESGDTMMLVGHNPGMEMLLMHYCPGVGVPADGKLMTTATVAALSLDSQEGTELLHLRRPGEE